MCETSQCKRNQRITVIQRKRAYIVDRKNLKYRYRKDICLYREERVGDDEGRDGVADVMSKCFECARDRNWSAKKSQFGLEILSLLGYTLPYCEHCSPCRELLVPGSWISSFESEDEPSVVLCLRFWMQFPLPVPATPQENCIGQSIRSDGKKRDDGTTTPIPFPLLDRCCRCPTRFCNKDFEERSINFSALTAS